MRLLLCICLFLFFCAVKCDEVVEEINNDEVEAVDQDAQENRYRSAMKNEDNYKRYEYVDDFVKRLAAYKYEDVNYKNHKKNDEDNKRNEGEDKKRNVYEDMKRDDYEDKKRDDYEDKKKDDYVDKKRDDDEEDEKRDGYEDNKRDAYENDKRGDYENKERDEYKDKERENYKRLPDYKDMKDNDEEYKNTPDYKDDDRRNDDAEGKKYDNYYDKEDNYYDQGKMGYRRRYDEPFNKKTIKKLDEIFDYTGPTANDGPENIIRPCALDDWQCIRKYFAANGQCNPAHGPIPDPFLIEKNTVYFAAVNVTATFLKYIIRGLSSTKINDFYVNKKSGNLVLALDVQDLNMTSPRAYLRYRRTAKESIVLADTSTINFRSLTFTAVIPKVPKLRLDRADIHVDIDDPYPIFAFGPEAITSTDPDVISAYAQLVALLPITVREGLIFLAPLITGMYIQETICDFGINENKKSGNVVIAIEIQNFNLSSPHAYFQYRRVAKEPIVTAGTSTINFQSILLTTVIPKNPDLRLDLAHAHIYSEDSRPIFRFSPGAYESTDPEVQRSYALLEGHLLPIAVKDSFLFQPQIFTTLFIQNAICDFGIKMTH